MTPENWKKIPLHLLAEIRTGIAKGKTGHKDPITLPYLRVANVQDGYLDLAEIKTIQVEKGQVERYALKSGDILMTEGGDFDKLGRGAVWRGQLAPCLHQNHVFSVRPDTAKVEPEFLSALAGSQYGRNYFLSCAKRSTNLASINSSQLKNFPVLVPPLEEQRHIARILGTWSHALAAADGLLANSKAQLQGLVAATLHLPPANLDAGGRSDNGGFPASVQPGIPNLPEPPEGWYRTSLGQHLKEVRRPVALEADQTYNLVTVKRSRGGVVLRDVLLGRDVKTSSQFYVRASDFLISKRQIVHGACGVVPVNLDGAVVSNEYAVLNSDGAIDLRFLRYLSETRYFQQTCFHSSIGVHVEKMIFNTERWLKWPFNIPPIPVQQKVVEVLDAARREVALYEAQIERLKQEKAALMAQLLTGKRRVRIPEAQSTP